jgi:hypothetical protein
MTPIRRSAGQWFTARASEGRAGVMPAQHGRANDAAQRETAGRQAPQLMPAPSQQPTHRLEQTPATEGRTHEGVIA